MRPMLSRLTARVSRLTLVAGVLAATSAGAGVGPGLTGNDTGGIISWSPENAQIARDWAADHCARYGKFSRITSWAHRPGDYIGFACFVPRGRG